MDLITIRNGRRIAGYEYRGVKITRDISNPKPVYRYEVLWKYETKTYEPTKLQTALDHIDRMLNEVWRDYHAKPIIHRVGDGRLIRIKWERGGENVAF